MTYVNIRVIGIVGAVQHPTLTMQIYGFTIQWISGSHTKTVESLSEPTSTHNWRNAVRQYNLIPKVNYANMKKEFPNTQAWKSWLWFHTAWSGKLVYISVKHHQFCFDFRKSWIADMMGK